MHEIHKIKTTLETVRDDIKKVYKYNTHHFMCVNGVALDENRLEVQWLFKEYLNKVEPFGFYLETDFNTPIPSISDIIPSSFISERELIDMFGVEVTGQSGGLFLDSDSMDSPLRKEK